MGVWKIGILFLLVSGILWFYSSTYKKYFLTGNLLVGILASLIPISAIVYEIPLLNMAYAELLIETGTNFLYMFDWVFGFAWFIFLNTLMYEINKDIYTVEGDRENGNHTIPVKLGIRAGRRNYYRFSRCSYDFGCAGLFRRILSFFSHTDLHHLRFVASLWDIYHLHLER